METQSLTATEFEAKCLEILDEVDGTNTVVTITKSGRPVATLHGVKKSAWRSPLGILEGKIDSDVVDALMGPAEGVKWDALEGIWEPPAAPGKRS